MNEIISKSFVTRIRNKVKSIAAGVRDGLEFRLLRHTQMSDVFCRALLVRQELMESYSEYTSTVSTRVMALSLETAALTGALLEWRRPTRIADLGSGYSSYVVRRYAPGGAHVVSVDDDPGWLGRTRSFLNRYGVGTSGLVHWEDFLLMDDEQYDLIVHDLGSMSLRIDALTVVMNRLAPGGLLVLDDVHKPGYGRAARITLLKGGFVPVSVRGATTDQFGRHALLAWPILRDHFRDHLAFNCN